jgi:hypothetical protein
MTEINKCLAENLFGTIYIQVIRIHGADHCDVRAEPEETPVIFIRLYHGNVPFVAPEIGIVITGDAAQECVTSITAVTQDMRYHGGDGCFAVRAGHANIKRAVTDQAKHLASFHYGIPAIQVIIQLLVVFRNGRCVHYQLHILAEQVCIIVIVNGYAAFFQQFRKLRWCFVITAYRNALGMKISCQCAHADAAYADKINLLYVA